MEWATSGGSASTSASLLPDGTSPIVRREPAIRSQPSSCGTEDLSGLQLGLGKTCPALRRGRRAKTCPVREDSCGSPSFGPSETLSRRAAGVPFRGKCAGHTTNLERRLTGIDPPGDFRPPPILKACPTLALPPGL
jgi:hypothetical protein